MGLTRDFLNEGILKGCLGGYFRLIHSAKKDYIHYNKIIGFNVSQILIKLNINSRLN